MTPSAAAPHDPPVAGPRQGSGHVVVVALACILAVAVAAAAGVAVAGRRLDSFATVQLLSLLALATALIGVGASVLSHGRWCRDLHETPMWLGASSLVVALGAATSPELLGPLLAGDGQVERGFTSVSAAASLVAPIVLVFSLVPVLGGWRPVRVLATSIATVAVVAVAVAVAAVDALVPTPVLSSLAGGALASVLWAVAAVAYLVRARRGGGGDLATAVAAATLSLSELVAIGAGSTSAALAVTAGLLRAGGVLVVLVALGALLARAFDEQRIQLFEAVLTAETSSTMERILDGEQRRRRHGAANALTAVEGAASILQQEMDTLSASDRSALGRMVVSGAASLRRTLFDDEGTGVSFALSDAAAACLSVADREQIDLHVADDVVVQGSRRQTEEALRRLLGVVEGHGAGRCVRVRGGREGAEAVLHIESSEASAPGHGVHAAVDTRSWRPGSDVDVGVLVAARLIQGQGGSLEVESGPGHRRSYTLRLPASTTAHQ